MSVNDFFIFGEFCEKVGPVVRQRYPEDSGMVEDAPMKDFIMRALSGDHVFSETELAYRPCESLIDKVSYTNKPLTALICSVSLYDVRARGYARTACVAYLTHDEHKLFAVSTWLSQHLNLITKMMYDKAFDRFRDDLAEHILALQFLQHNDEARSALSERVQRSVADELANLILKQEALNKHQRPAPTQQRQNNGGVLLGRAEGSRRSTTVRSTEARPHPPTSGTTSPSGSFSEPMNANKAVPMIEALIGSRGEVPLRSIEEICGEGFSAAFVKYVNDALSIFSYEPSWIVENAVQSMKPLPRLMDEPIGNFVRMMAQTAQEKAQEKPTQQAHMTEQYNFYIGDCCAVDTKPLNFPQMGKSSHKIITDLNDDPCGVKLYELFRRYKKELRQLVFHTLACVPVIICGSKRDVVEEAMCVAAMFVPGLLQSNRPRFQLGYLEVQPSEHTRVSPLDLEQFAVIGCPTSAALDKGSPFLPGAFVWHVEQKGATLTINSYAPSRTTEGNDRSSSFLNELFDEALNTAADEQDKDSLSAYIRLLLKRTFFEIGTAAALVIATVREATKQHVNTGSGGLGTTDVPDSARPSNASFATSESGGNVLMHRNVFVLCESEVIRCLRNCHGYAQVAPDDAVIITSVARRMLQLMSENKSANGY